METRTVLFVDDDNGILNALKRVLRSEPYKCLLADSGRKALEILEKESINVIVTDLEMPEMDGFTLLKEVRKKYPDIIRLILSGRTDTVSVLDSINTGNVYRYIMKPWNGVEVKTTIRQAIDLFNLEKERDNLLKENAYRTQREPEESRGYLIIQDNDKVDRYFKSISNTMENRMNSMEAELDSANSSLRDGNQEARFLKNHLDQINSGLKDLRKMIREIPIGFKSTLDSCSGEIRIESKDKSRRLIIDLPKQIGAAG
ncbi:MAG: response regulator [Desulfatiglans sp.]|jgi:DNA-binding NtrC family response regulator|nr:response regulator [Thermodesulfobacteriota bacterium]MEE4352112.1 response regulator [Desulfatiglans sp.]